MNDFDDSGALILCVEDEDDLRNDIVEELQAAGYRTMEAGDGYVALAILAEQKPDLVLCDITMPGLDGYGVMRELRTKRSDMADVPFLFLTALAGRADVIQGKAAGADDYLVKPIDYDIMLATIRSRLAQVHRIRRNIDVEIAETRRGLAAAIVERSQEAVALVASTLDRMAAGFVLVEPALELVQANATARAIFEEADGVSLRGGKLAGVSAQTLRRLFVEMVEQGKSGRAIALERPYRRPLLAQVSVFSSEPARLALVLLDPDRQPVLSSEVAIQMYGLTPTEAKIAIALAGGKRTDEIADDFSIAATTISFHLQNLFRKTQTTRQSDLIALMLRSALPAEAAAAN